MKKVRTKKLSIADKFKYKNNVYKMLFSNSGPGKQFVFILRFPVSYKHNQLLSYRVEFTSFFDWMGQIREYSVTPIIQSILRLTRKGNWGLATNSVKLKVFDFFSEDDIVEGRLWLERISGHDNIYHLSYDWLRFLGKNRYERVASSSIVITCVKIIGHGSASIIKPPPFLDKFFRKMLPVAKYKGGLLEYPTRFNNLNFGERIKSFADCPKLIFKSSYQSTLDNSNLIGNIYFSNYAKWINSTKDLFLFRNFPKILYRSEIDAEFCTVDFSISHKQEAMPFDEIRVEMYAVEVYKKAIFLKYEVFKDDERGHPVLLASAKQNIAFFDRNINKTKLIDIPAEMLAILT